MVLLTAVFVTDRAVIARYSGEALASLHISTTLSWTACSVFSGLAVGTLAVVGRAVGARLHARAAQLTRAALLTSLATGVVVAATLLSLRQTLVSFLFGGAPVEVMSLADDYLVIVLPALPLCFVEMTASAALHAAGDTRTPLTGALVGNALNLACSATLVFGLAGMPELGVRGAAIGSALAFCTGATITVARLHAMAGPIPLSGSLRAWRASLCAIRPVWRVARATFGEKVTYHAGYLIHAALIVSLGASAMSANQALLGIEATACAIADGLAIAAGALVAQDLGANRPQRAHTHRRAAATIAVVVLCALGLVFAYGSRAALTAFAPAPTAAPNTVAAMMALAIAQPFMAYATVNAMALRGAGATRVVWLGAAIGTLLVRPLASFALAIVAELGLFGIWLGSCADWVVRCAVFALAWRRTP